MVIFYGPENDFVCVYKISVSVLSVDLNHRYCNKNSCVFNSVYRSIRMFLQTVKSLLCVLCRDFFDVFLIPRCEAKLTF